MTIPALTITPTDLDKTIRTVAGEARGEPPLGQVAIAWVIRHRACWDEELHPGVVEHEWWGVSPATVCTHPWQFSCWNGGDDTDFIKAMQPTDALYATLRQMVLGVFAGTVADPTGGSTTYKVKNTPASWDRAVAGHTPRVLWHHQFWRMTPGGLVLPFTQ